MRTRARQAALAALFASIFAASPAPAGAFPNLPVLPAAAAPAPGPNSIRVYSLGITTLLFDDGETRLLVDGFISRPPFRKLVSGFEPDEKKIDNTLTAMIGDRSLAAVLVAHAHYDHAMDARYIAWRRGAKLVGSRSVAMIGDPAGRPAPDTWIPADGEMITCGRFKVTVRHGPHSERNLADGEIETTLTPPANGLSYKANDSHAFLIEHQGRKILVQPSANLPETPPPNPKADVVFLSIGMLGRRGRSFAARYWDALVDQKTQEVILIHCDDPLSPAASQNPAPLPDFVGYGLWLIKKVATVREKSDTLHTLPVGRPVDLSFPDSASDTFGSTNPAGVCSRSGPPAP